MKFLINFLVSIFLLHFIIADIIDSSSVKSGRQLATGAADNDGPIFYGGVFDLQEFSKMANIPIAELIGLHKQQNGGQLYPDEEDEEDEYIDGSNRKKMKKKTSLPLIQGHHMTRKRKKKRKRPRPDRYEDIEDLEDSVHQDYDQEYEDDEDEEPVNEPMRHHRPKQKLRSKNKVTSTTSTTTTVAPPPQVAPVQYPGYPFMYPPPYPYMSPYPTHLPPPNLPESVSPSKSGSRRRDQEASESTVVKKVVKKPTRLDDDDESSDAPVVRPVKEQIINVNLPDIFGVDGLFDHSSSHNDNSFLMGNTNRRVSFGGFTQGIVKRALRSMMYRIFPTLNTAKRVAAKGCRDVQTIGSMDSILMPLGIAVTLHPLLLPLVPFLLLALGSIKAIESATCFVSEFFK